MSAGFTKPERDAIKIAIANRLGDIDKLQAHEATLPREIRDELSTQRAALHSALEKLPRMREVQ